MIIHTTALVLAIATTVFFAYRLHTAARARFALINALSLPKDASWGDIVRAARVLKHREKDQRARLLSRALNLLNEGLVIMSPEGKIIYANRFARELLGIDKDDFGSFFYEVVNDLDIVSFINRNFQSKFTIWENKRIGDRFVQLLFASDEDEKALLIRDLTMERRYEDLKKDFIANVSHEFKTPVATLKLLVETLDDECVDVKNAPSFLKKAKRTIAFMEQLIQDLLTLTMLETEKGFEKSVSPVKLKKLIDGVFEEVSVFANERDIKLKNKLPDSLQVVADERLMHYIFKNLIDNAVKYNKKGGEVEVFHEDYPKEFVVCVKDTGIGIPKSHIPFIFERFYRVEKSRSRKLGGTGLGLSIVKLAADKVGGKISVESCEGQGTTFKISFPKERLLKAEAI